MKKLAPEILRKHKGISFVGVSTCFLCHDGRGEFFMAKRSHKSRDEKGTWEIGGGGLKWRITAEDNIRREVKEEYNAEPLKIDFFGYRDVLRQLEDGTATHWLALDFAVLVKRDDVRINELDMFDDSGWFNLGSLPDPLHSQQPTFFNKYSAQLKEILSKSA